MEAGQLLEKEETSARRLAQLVGRMAAAILAMYPAPLHYRSLQTLKHRALTHNGYDGIVKPQYSIEMDASTTGCWNVEEQRLHIKLELLTVFHAVKYFLKKRRGLRVPDNMAVVSHINKVRVDK